MHSSSIYCTSCGAGNRVEATYCFSCGKQLQRGTLPPSQTPPTPAPSFPLGGTGRLPLGYVLRQRYKIVSLLGRGGMGAVYQAEDQQFGNRPIAVKEMSQSNLLDPQEVAEIAEQFKQEALMLAVLKHPNLPSIYDHFSEDGRWYLVMDFIEGNTLEDHLKKAPGHILPVAETLDIGIQLTKVLGYLHTRPKPIIFRDLKPLNIMITPEKHIYLIDFGIARLFKPGQAKDTVAYFSTGYAAPEQFGQAQTTPQSDIFSLGATLHRLLSGHDPRSNMPLFNFKPLQSYNPSLPSSLSNLIAQMVDPDMGRRPTSMAFIRQELEQIQDQQKQLGRQYIPPPPPPPSLQPQRLQQKISVTPYQVQPTPIPSPQPQHFQQQQVSSPSHQKQTKPALPKNGIRNAIAIGIVTGLLYFAAILGINYVHVPLADWVLLTILLLLAFFSGFMTGKVAVARSKGLLTGVVAGLTFGSIVLGIDRSLYNIIPILIVVVVGGILSLSGAWLATRKHPYYKK